MGPDQPFYSMQAIGLNGPETPQTSVEEMAEHYISEIRAVLPEGPYLLGGRCFGGFVAMEMARRLREAGLSVPLLALLGPSQPPPPISLREYLRYLLLHHLPRGQFFYCLSRDIRERTRNMKLKLMLGRQRRRVLRVWETHNRARRTYQPKPYPGRITLIVSREFNIRFPEYLSRWEALTEEGVDYNVIPGGHRGLLREPNLAAVVEQLTSCLARAVASPED